MSFEQGLSTDYSRRQFMAGAGALLLGGTALLQSDTGPLEINHSADPSGVMPAQRVDPPSEIYSESQSIKELFMPGGLYRVLDVGGQKLVTLTLDDGPWPVNTEAIMNTLAKNDLEGCATLFQVADNVAQFADIAREAYARGFTIGNHSKTHPSIASAIPPEIPLAQQIIYETIGHFPEVFRSPGLNESQAIQDMLAKLGMCNIFTDRDPNDWTIPRISSQEIIQNVSNQLHPGGIILLHDGGSHINTVNAIQGIIDAIYEKGYKLVTLKQMFQASAGAVLTPNRIEDYRARSQYPDFSNDTFDRAAELKAIGLTPA